MITREADKTFIFNSKQSDDLRLGNTLKSAPSFKDTQTIEAFLQSEKAATIYFGYPDDEGIKINNGRIGAALAPNQIRTFLYKMTPALNYSHPFSLIDLGDLSVQEIPFEKRHLIASECAQSALNSDHRWVGVGGGHDYGFSEGRALIEFARKEKKTKPLIINFDAHLDVRTSAQGFNSGTPFYRLLNDYKGEFDFAEVAIQSQCNSQKHLEFVKSHGGKVLLLDELVDSDVSLDELLKQQLGHWLSPARLTYLSIDIDAFSSGVAMGASQSWPIGLLPQSFFKAFRNLVRTLDVRVLGIYEVSPPLDFDHLTSKLAAQIIHQFIFAKRN